MDEGPFRMPRASGRPERRSESAPAANRQPQTATSSAQPMARPQEPVKQTKSASRWPIFVVIVLLVVGLALATFAWLRQDKAVGNFIQNDTYQAVFSANGQVYFGKLDAASGDELRLTDVYYVQAPDANDSSDDASKSSNDLELIKLGNNEVYGPQDEMVFMKHQVLYYENLDPNGKVSNLIRDNQGN